MNNSLSNRLNKIEVASALATSGKVLWTPLPGPQTMAFESDADVIGFGGAAGGGKSDLAIGKALLKHKRIAIFRKNGTELVGVIDRVAEILGTRDGLNQVNGIWRIGKNKVIEFCATPNPGDEKKYQGRPRDLLIIDEAANFPESQIRFLMGWLRTTTPNQKVQAIFTFNPPQNAEGRWLIKYFAPWLDKGHINPAMPGELRWFAMIDGKEVEVPSGDLIENHGEKIKPQSRTFIPSRIADNPYLTQTGYMAQLQSLPEPLRSQLLYGDFEAGMEDDAMQVIPTAWIQQAMDRWKEKDVKPTMTSIGVDVARGGKDATTISRRHGNWFDKILTYPGNTTPDGPTVAGLAIAAMRDRCNILIDVIGVGAAPYDFLVEAKQPVYGINVAERANAMDKSGRMGFKNLRSQLYWQLRESLDPQSNEGIALPPDAELLADLAAFKWKLSNSLIQVESRDEVVKRIGRSPDKASSLMLTVFDAPNLDSLQSAVARSKERVKSFSTYDPYEYIGTSAGQRTLDYDPMKYTI